MQRTYQLDAGQAGHGDAAALAALIAAGVTCHFADGAFIQHEGDPTDGIFVIVDGIVAIGHHTADGAFSVVALGGAGDISGEMAHFGNVPRQFDAVAKGRAAIAFVNRHRLERLLEDDPRIARLLLHSMARQMLLLGSLLESERSQPARLRLARLLLAQSSRDQPVVVASQQDLASLLGVSRVTMVSALNELVSAGLVECGYRRLSIADHAGLADWISRQSGKTTAL